jgi:putative membrane protein
MKAMKTISHFLAAAALMLTASCSSTNTGTSTGASTGGSVPSDSDITQTGTGSSLGVPGAATDANVPTNTAVVAGTSATGTSTSSATSTGGADMAADQTAFMATFATMDDPTFMLTAASSNMLEIELGRMATQQSANANVKKYGQMMVDHHTKATQDWKAVATPMKVQMPTTMMPVHQALADRVKGKSGKEFDEAYMDAMETAHKMDVAMFEAKSKQAQAPAVKNFANKTLPMLRSHHTMADAFEKKVD